MCALVKTYPPHFQNLTLQECCASPFFWCGQSEGARSMFFFNYQMRFYSVASHVSWRWPWSLACLRCLYPWRLFLNALATWASHVNFLSMFLQFVLWNAYCMLRQAFDRLAQEHQKQWIARLEQASSGVIWNRTFTITGLLLYSYSWTGEPFVNTSGEQKK